MSFSYPAQDLYIGIHPSVRYEVGEEIFSFPRVPFCLIHNILCLWKPERFLIVAFSVCDSGFLFRKLFPMVSHSRLLLTFCSVRFRVAGFILRSWIHLNLSLVQGDWYLSLHSSDTVIQFSRIIRWRFFPFTVMETVNIYPKVMCSYVFGFKSGFWFEFIDLPVSFFCQYQDAFINKALY